jgi:hypothetical protein
VSDFVDVGDPQAVADVVRRVLPVMGLDGLLEQLSGLPGLRVIEARPRGLLRPAVPAEVQQGDLTLRSTPDGAVLLHVVGGIALSHEQVPPAGVPEVLARLLGRAVAAAASGDEAAVRLTALRDVADL